MASLRGGRVRGAFVPAWSRRGQYNIKVKVKYRADSGRYTFLNITTTPPEIHYLPGRNHPEIANEPCVRIILPIDVGGTPIEIYHEAVI
jgi:hypothetical protein